MIIHDVLIHSGLNKTGDDSVAVKAFDKSQDYEVK